ncbi:MAG TPA: hypothetical protein VFJ19_14000 [Nocardioidaceae bacterium]|nr:hypothetical protein [Nocardioidaceae bacterium]
MSSDHSTMAELSETIAKSRIEAFSDDVIAVAIKNSGGRRVGRARGQVALRRAEEA